jgi:hypothetical protein
MAVKEAPVQVIEEILPDINTRYAYVLAKENDKRGMVYDENNRPRWESKYKPSVNLLTRSSIVWDGSPDPFSKKPRAKGRHQIRYYDGCTTLFVDDQPREKDVIDQLLSASRDFTFDYGYLYVYGYDVMLKLYCDWCSYNEESPYKVPSVPSIFKSVNTEKQSKAEEALLDQEDEARGYASDATPKKMRIHARYLGIPFADSITQQPLSDKAIRVEYRKKAKENPAEFIKSYKDDSIEISTWVTQALEGGEITTSLIPDKAMWSKSKTEICDLLGFRAQNLIVDRITEYMRSVDGNDSLAQLKVLYG